MVRDSREDDQRAGLPAPELGRAPAESQRGAPGVAGGAWPQPRPGAAEQRQRLAGTPGGGAGRIT
eukprot:7622456-Lingulodinium_polyedra.AAC.1